MPDMARPKLQPPIPLYKSIRRTRHSPCRSWPWLLFDYTRPGDSVAQSHSRRRSHEHMGQVFAPLPETGAPVRPSKNSVPQAGCIQSVLVRHRPRWSGNVPGCLIPTDTGFLPPDRVQPSTAARGLQHCEGYPVSPGPLRAQPTLSCRHTVVLGQ